MDELSLLLKAYENNSIGIEYLTIDKANELEVKKGWCCWAYIDEKKDIIVFGYSNPLGAVQECIKLIKNNFRYNN